VTELLYLLCWIESGVVKVMDSDANEEWMAGYEMRLGSARMFGVDRMEETMMKKMCSLVIVHLHPEWECEVSMTWVRVM